MSTSLGRGIAAFYAFFPVCCLGVVGKTRKSLSVVVGIAGNSNKPKLGRVMRQKAHLSVLAQALLPSTPSVCFSRSIGSSLIFVAVVVGITTASITGSSNEPNPGRVMHQKARR